MRRLVAFASVVLTIVAIACGGGDDPTAPTAANQPTATPQRLGPDLATASNGNGLSITTDKDDYSPGDTVWFTGAGWQPGDTLDIVLAEEPQLHDPHTWWIPVDSAGAFKDSTYVVDVGDVGIAFTLTATSRANSEQRLSVQFTDGNINVLPSPSGVQFIIQATRYTATTNCSGASTTLTPPGGTTVGSAGITFQAQTGQSVLLQAASASTLGAAFSDWTTTDPGVQNESVTSLCVLGFGPNLPGGGNRTYTAVYDAAPDLTISKSASGTFGVGSATAQYSFQVNNVGTATAEGTAANRITVTDDLPTGLTPPASPFNVSNWDCTVSGLTVTCQLATGQNILPGASRTFSFNVGVTAAACPSVTNSARVSGGNEPSSKQGNNTSTSITTSISSGCVNPNQAPTANPGGPYTADEGSVKLLDGSGSSDPENGTDITYAWSVDFSGNTAPYVAIDAGGECKFYTTSDASDAGTPTSTLQKPYIKCSDDGVFKVMLVVTDKGSPPLSSTQAVTQLTVTNVKPTATFTAESPVNEGSTFKLELTNAVDPSSVDQAGLKYAFDCGDGAGYSALSTSAERSCPTTDNGSRAVKGKVRDDDGGESEYTGSVTVDNVAPTATFHYPAANVPEGTSFTLSLDGEYDPSSADVTGGFRYAFDCGDPSSPVTLPVTYAAASTSTSVTCGTTDNGVRTVKGRIFDKDDGYTTYTQTVTVVNVEPSVSITAPLNYSVWAITAIEFSSVGFVTAPFTDPGTADTHTCAINWGEGTTNAGTVTESSGSGTCRSVAGNQYTDNGAGIYDISVKVTDDDGGEGSASVTIIVYDPSAGFVTGGGWINSPKGACHTAACTYDTDGRANFGFVSKYQKGASVPTGQTEFQFQSGDLNFHSGVYEWLVVNQAGTNAQYKGVGTINGQSCGADFQGKCRFMLWATDGTKNGGYDTFRISIWTEDSGGNKTYVYDNGSGSGFSTAAIGGGSIQVQTGKK